MQGFNGQVNISTGTGHKYTGGINLNYRTGNWNFFTNYSYQYREFWEVTNSLREDFNPTGSVILDQDYYTENWRHGQLIRLGTEYSINDNSSLRLYTNINDRWRDRERLYTIRNYTAHSPLDSLYERLLTEDQNRINYEAGTDFNWQNDNGSRFRASATFAWDDQDRIEYFDQTQSYFDPSGDLSNRLNIDQFYERPRSGNMLVMQADYEYALGEDISIETGLRGELRLDDRSQRFGQIEGDDTLSIVLNGIPVSNAFTHERNIYAAYLSFTDNRRALSYQLGLRAEYTMMENWQDYTMA